MFFLSYPIRIRCAALCGSFLSGVDVNHLLPGMNKSVRILRFRVPSKTHPDAVVMTSGSTFMDPGRATARPCRRRMPIRHSPPRHPDPNSRPGCRYARRQRKVACVWQAQRPGGENLRACDNSKTRRSNSSRYTASGLPSQPCILGNLGGDSEPDNAGNILVPARKPCS